MQTENSITLKRTTDLPLASCPACQMTWLTPGLSDGDKYDCKKCGFTFLIGRISNNPFTAVTSNEQPDS